jgi:alpha-galactosidase/6-phospho-beta-glucosidase family protein
VTGQRGTAPKIAVIGGGSYQWGTKIIQDVALSGDLQGSILTLHDIDPEALDDLYRWGGKMVDLAGADLALEKTGDLADALSGADFVVLCISTGGAAEPAAYEVSCLCKHRLGLFGAHSPFHVPSRLVNALAYDRVLIQAILVLQAVEANRHSG